MSHNGNGRKFVVGKLPLDVPVMAFHDWCGLMALITGHMPDMEIPENLRTDEWISAVEFARHFREQFKQDPISVAPYL